MERSWLENVQLEGALPRYCLRLIIRKARVVRLTEHQGPSQIGFALEFSDLSAEDQKALSHFVRDTEIHHLRRRTAIATELVQARSDT